MTEPIFSERSASLEFHLRPFDSALYSASGPPTSARILVFLIMRKGPSPPFFDTVSTFAMYADGFFARLASSSVTLLWLLISVSYLHYGVHATTQLRCDTMLEYYISIYFRSSPRCNGWRVSWCLCAHET